VSSALREAPLLRVDKAGKKKGGQQLPVESGSNMRRERTGKNLPTRWTVSHGCYSHESVSEKSAKYLDYLHTFEKRDVK